MGRKAFSVDEPSTLPAMADAENCTAMLAVQGDQSHSLKKRKHKGQAQVLHSQEELDEEERKKKKKEKKEKRQQKKEMAMEKEKEMEREREMEIEMEKETKKEKKKKNKKKKKSNGAAAEEASPQEKEEKMETKTKKEQQPLGKEGADNAKDINGGGINNVNPENGTKKDEEGELQVTVSGIGSDEEKFRCIEAFEQLQVPANVLGYCKRFKKPSPIQSYAWPFLLSERDLIGIARTGSGKTLAFGLPALVHVLNCRKSSKQRFPVCLVLSPTRELAQQIADVLEDAGNECNVKCVSVYGGTSKGAQSAAIRSGVDIIVATPGRLQDLLEGGACDISKVSFLVLDEADRMLDLGFEYAVRTIIGQTSKSRQTLMFSATWPPAVDELSKEYMSTPVKVIVGSQNLTANHDVTQIVEVVEDRARDSRLLTLLQQYHKDQRNRVLVFVLYKKEAVRVEEFLQRRGWKVSAVHGDKQQNSRTKAVAAFKDGTCPLLVATDVAARGLDIPDVEYVINYSFPLTTEDYVHRIGRTGRAGKTGISHTFFTTSDKHRAGELVNVLREAGQNVPSELLKFGTHVKKKESTLYGAHFKEISENAPKATKITFDSDNE